MLIKKDSNENVRLFSDNAESNSIGILVEFPRIMAYASDSIKIDGYDQPIKVSNIYLDDGSGIVQFTGSRDELIEELSSNFFF